LNVAVFLYREGHVVVFRREQSYRGHPRGKASGYVGSLPRKTWIKGDLTLHTDDLVPRVEIFEGGKLGLITQVSITRGRRERLRNSHSGEDLVGA